MFMSSTDYEWVPASNGDVPDNAVQGGNDTDCSPIYVGRATHEGDRIPAKVIPNKGGAFIPWGGEEVSIFEYEVRT